MENIPKLLLTAWLLPLASFTIICIGYSIPQMLGMKVRYSTQKYAGYIACAAIILACVCSMTAMFGYWLPTHPLPAAEEHLAEHDAAAGEHAEAAEGAHEAEHADHGDKNAPKLSLSGDWYALGVFGNL